LTQQSEELAQTKIKLEEKDKIIEKYKSDKKVLKKKLKVATTKSLKLKSQKQIDFKSEIEKTGLAINNLFGFLL